MVDVRDEVTARLYRLNGQALKPIHDWVKNYERLCTDRFEQLDAVIEGICTRRRPPAVATSGTATVTLAQDNQILITREASGRAQAPGLEGLHDPGVVER